MQCETLSKKYKLVIVVMQKKQENQNKNTSENDTAEHEGCLKDEIALRDLNSSADYRVHV